MRVLAIVMCAGFLMLWGCEGDDTDAAGVGGEAGSGAAGSGGDAGSDGGAGAAGTGGDAGSGGDAGTANTGGDAGTANTGGDAGTANTGGDAGAGGTGGDAGAGGTGGDAGAGGTGGDAGAGGTGGDAGSAGTGGDAGSGGNAGAAGMAGDYCHNGDDDAYGSATTMTPQRLRRLDSFSTTLRDCSLSASEAAICAGAEHEATVTIRDGKRVISGNAIPNHDVDYYPNEGNPNRISAQSESYEVTISPSITSTMTETQVPGVAINGIKYEPQTAEVYSNTNWRYEALTFGGRVMGDTNRQPTGDTLGIDCNFAHVQPSGAYHYHGVPTGLMPTEAAITLVGWAADGFPMLGRFGYATPGDSESGIVELNGSYQIKAGARTALSAGETPPPGDYDGTFVQDWEYVAGSGDLDQCNGRSENITIDGETFEYAYYVTHTYPFLQRCVWGTPDSSFGGRPGGPMGGDMMGGVPGSAVTACVGLSEGAACSFINRMNLERTGTCQTRGDRLVCLP